MSKPIPKAKAPAKTVPTNTPRKQDGSRKDQAWRGRRTVSFEERVVECC